MLRGLDFRADDVIVEYGPGTGAITRVLRERLRPVPRVRYLGIEREAAFCKILQETMPELAFANGSAEDVRQLLEEHGLPAPRFVISGLPLILMDSMEQIVETVANVLPPGGCFHTFSYLHSYPMRSAKRLRSLMAHHFDRFELSPLVVRNVPPAFVLRGVQVG